MSAELQELFDGAGRNPPAPAFDADAVLRRAQRSNQRRITGVLAAGLVATVALGAVLVSQWNRTSDPEPAPPRPTAPALGALGDLAFGLNGAIYVADRDGKHRVGVDASTSEKESGAVPRHWGEGPIWSPDGRYLAYRGSTTSDDAVTTGGSWDHGVTISDESGHLVVSFPAEGWDISWSPDSSRVATWVDFTGDYALGIYGLDGVRQALLTVPPELMPPGDWDPVWSLDGQSLLGPHGLKIPVDGSEPRRWPQSDPRSQAWWYAYSPDGANIAYISEDGLSVAAVDGSRAHVLVSNGLGVSWWWSNGPAWSPTGDQIAFMSQVRGEFGSKFRKNQLAVLDVASGTVVPLADMGGGADWLTPTIEFSPEGDRIMFVKLNSGDTSLWSVQTDGSDLHRLVAGAGWGDWQTVRPTR